MCGCFLSFYLSIDRSIYLSSSVSLFLLNEQLTHSLSHTPNIVYIFIGTMLRHSGTLYVVILGEYIIECISPSMGAKYNRPSKNTLLYYTFSSYVRIASTTPKKSIRPNIERFWYGLLCQNKIHQYDAMGHNIYALNLGTRTRTQRKFR